MTIATPTTDPLELQVALQQRADYIPIEDLSQETSEAGDLFQKVFRELINRGLRTLVGPRGCGKTHLMRYTWLQCRNTMTRPFAVFVSFNRYFRLEPLLSSQAGALEQFHSWVLARTILSILDSANEWQPKLSVADLLPDGLSPTELQTFVNRVERSVPPDTDSALVGRALSIDLVQKLASATRERAERKHTILLMDDAALTLTPDYLVEFLDIVRSLKTVDLAPKASVYPGTTEMSPRFHEGQDSIAVPVWLSVEDPAYEKVIDGIARARVRTFDQIPDDAKATLRFAAFGIPRAYLTMLDEFGRGGFASTQQGVSRIIQHHLDARVGEFRSLGTKVPKLDSLVVAGEAVLEAMAKEIKTANDVSASRDLRQLTYGVVESDLTPIVERMFRLLIEAGLVYDNGTVKHGTPERIYRRYIPHAALLISIRALGGGTAGGSLRQTIDAIARKSEKHPVRKGLQRAVPNLDLSQLSFSLPKCAACGTTRITDSQRFCHHCGQMLVEASTFAKCLDTRIDDVPGLSDWQRNQITQFLPAYRTLRDFLAKQDPAADLLTVRGFGRQRTTKIVDVLNGFVDEYLS
ncbi:hypothetical protein DFR29_12196 [Tahibacter aquaticus]|uniref:Zinc ribbon domain-containing protein n=1 Tax=Tahibacter aquaticus TaxID=520092 RepID=A0A4R6YMH6_9GAMM|nr:zinc ribbon domain-containing protein [Tahibacter aquaticus]TDR38424.1 hypothetical protein DFR29_12196 [Tahibacter aquaticus]